MTPAPHALQWPAANVVRLIRLTFRYFDATPANSTTFDRASLVLKGPFTQIRSAVVCQKNGVVVSRFVSHREVIDFLLQFVSTSTENLFTSFFFNLEVCVVETVLLQ